MCLSLQNNRVVKIENLDKLVNLTELYLSENGIEKIENLEHNTKVETLDIAKNRIKLIENIGKLTEMDEFWVRSLLIRVLFDILLIFFLTGQRQSSFRLEVHRRAHSQHEARNSLPGKKSYCTRCSVSKKAQARHSVAEKDRRNSVHQLKSSMQLMFAPECLEIKRKDQKLVEIRFSDRSVCVAG